MKVITYEEWLRNPTPRMMWVWDNNPTTCVKRKVVYFSGKDMEYPVIAVVSDETIDVRYKHCAEIEEQKTRRMTNQELAWWLREKPTREYKRKYQISVYYEYIYTDEEADELVEEDIVIRENGGEWREPLVEVE